MRVAAFFAAFICGVITWAFYRMAINARIEENNRSYPFVISPLSLFINAILFGCFAIFFLLYSVGLWDIICDAIVDWLSPSPRIKS